MQIELTGDEAKTLHFYLEKMLIEAEGLNAVGVTSKKTVKNLESIMQKLTISQNAILLEQRK